ncbi:DUF3761 domain-containing protein [Paraburkholderia sp. Se-20369]|nr:DUF3761 domain-containing protein [Paraburkholderia sp. Se-20369]
MKKSTSIAALAASLCVSLSSFAQVPASAPTGTTGLCNDGSFSASVTKQGACQGHKGVKTWYGAAASGTVAANATTMAAPASGTKVAPATIAAAAPGGGAGKVWVNARTKVYHCPGDKSYGKTKHGQYLSEAAAKAAGDRPAQGKTCS